MTERPSLLDLSELEDDLVPEILPSSATLSVVADVNKLRLLFARASGVSPSKEVVPGTAYALLEAFPSTADSVAYLRITASDGEQTVSVVVDDVQVRIPGQVLLPPRRVSDILKLAPTTKIDLTVVGSSALIRSGRVRWTVAVPEGSVADLSSLVDVSAIPTQHVPAQAFLRGLQAARKAASTSHARVSLMQVQIKDGSIIACDGGRLHQAYVAGMDPAMDTTIPVRVVDELIKALQDAEDLVLGSDDANLVFHIGSDSIVAQRMLLPFPDVGQLMLAPRLSNSLTLTVDRAQLDDAVRRVRVNADPDYAVVLLSVLPSAEKPGGWQLEVSSRDRTGNNASEAIDCQWSGKQMTVAYNHHHLIDLLSVCTSEHLFLRMGEDTKSTRTPVLVEDSEAGITGIVQQVTQHW